MNSSGAEPSSLEQCRAVQVLDNSSMLASKSVAEGEIIRRNEAMDSLVNEVSRGEDESLPASLRSALEV